MRAHVIMAMGLAAVLAMPPLSASAAEPDTSAPIGIEVASTPGALAPATASDFSTERAFILQQTNQLRADNGLAPLRLNTALNEIAHDWSAQQASVSTMSHRPNFTSMYPIGWSRAGENVAAGYAYTSVVNAWAASPGHRANMLSATTDIGIGVAVNANGRPYYTQNFGRYTTPPPTPPGTVSRIAGSDRYTTSALISSQAFPGGATTVYIASGADFPDALSAAALAGAADGPLLLVQRTGVPPAILAELRRLAPDRIVVAGGVGVISDAVITTLRTVTPNVARVFGGDRHGTSRALALDAYGVRGASVVYLATGAGFADALAAGPAAASVNAPVVLVAGTQTTVDSATLSLLRTLRTTSVVIVGGTGAVSAGIEASLRGEGLTLVRYAGADRYATASQIAAAHFPHATGSFLATGSGFADALSGGAAAGALGAPLFTMRPDCVPAPAHSALVEQNPDTMMLLGGFGALLPAVAGFYRC